MQEKEHVLGILKKTREAVQKEDVIALRDLSDQTIHSASIYKDTDSITIAVMIYSLSKILERTRYKEYPGWKNFYNEYLYSLNSMIKAVEEDNLKKFKESVTRIRKAINSLSGKFKKHIQDVFRRAEISKASRIYEHGISLETTASMLGITVWELAEYSGQTGISDVNLNITMKEKDRIKFLDIFK